MVKTTVEKRQEIVYRVELRIQELFSEIKKQKVKMEPCGNRNDLELYHILSSLEANLSNTTIELMNPT